MNNLESRIEKLENRVDPNKRERVTLIVVAGESVCDGMDTEARKEAIEPHKEAANAKVEAVIAEYIAAHPECSEEDIDIIIVASKKAKENLKRTQQGERT